LGFYSPSFFQEFPKQTKGRKFTSSRRPRPSRL